ncbi:bacteriocin-like protein [Chryseobacterium sp. JUb7]|uniref:bacteriocin-like protein n=1 Tax=Chryseobacterium sp. JUb7 TaxID=2940599 RepID=UPI002169F6E2|nr:hypothetical protein [Chryseobacterium sp. JUb7]MCS3528920.1 phage-related protein [Chryseobacterium sp. JUb7]
MKNLENLKKLDRNQLKTISGDGIDGLLTGLGTLVGNLLDGVGGVLQGTVVGTLKTLEGGLCEVNCLLKDVIEIKIVKCGPTC